MRVLLITGWGFTEDIWQPFERKVADEWQVKSLDFLRGFTEISNSGYCRQLKSIIKQFKPDAVVGWSMGAIVILETLADFELPDFLTVLLAGSARFIQEDDTAPAGIEPVRLRAMKRGISRNPVSTLEQFYSLAASPEENKSKIAQIDNPGSWQKKLLEGLEYLEGVDLTDRLDKIDRRVQLIHGREDAVIPFRAGCYLNNKLPGGNLIEAGGGHLAPVRSPGVLVEILQNYLEGCR